MFSGLTVNEIASMSPKYEFLRLRETVGLFVSYMR
jgi:hypothetical protein